MNRIFVILASAVTFFLHAGTCNAEPVLSLSSSSDLSSLPVGATVTFQVGLSGLMPGDKLEFLAATAKFDGSLLGTPTILAGPIIPDAGGFLKSEIAGLADGLYDSLLTLSGDRIVTNGIFYSFDATVKSAGTGSVGFDFVSSTGVDASGARLGSVAKGGSLPFTTTTGVIPEPSAWLLWIIGMSALALLGLRRILVGGDQPARNR